jgi:hypothetical protein
VSVGSTPASAQYVANQSATCISPCRTVPRTVTGRYPPDAKLLARIPPSKKLYLPPPACCAQKPTQTNEQAC